MTGRGVPDGIFQIDPRAVRLWRRTHSPACRVALRAETVAVASRSVLAVGVQPSTMSARGEIGGAGPRDAPRRALMADQTAGNGADGTSEATASPGPQQLILNAQYIKDLSFENPRAPQSLVQPVAQPEVEINVDVKARN